MKQVFTVIVVFAIIISAIGVVEASYYNVKSNIGEYSSEISNQLFLDYSDQLSNYKFSSQIKISKDYRFLAGKKYEEDWEYNDYFIKISNENNELELGETEAESLSNFFTAESLLGISLQRNNYNLWYGQNANEDFSFGGQSSGLDRLGFSYDGQKRKVSYQYQEDLVTDRHYFSYQNGYKFKQFDLLVDTAAAATNQEIGPAARFDLSSWYQGINYRWITNYYSPEYQEIEKNIFASGQYDTNLQLYKKLNSRYILESRVNYSTDNLNDSQSVTNRNWGISNTLSYFSPYYNVYQLGIDYKINNRNKNRLKLNLSGDLDKLNFQLVYRRQIGQEVYAELTYEGPRYSYLINYTGDKDDNEWSHDAETELGYKVDLTQDLASNSIVNLSYLYDAYRVNLTQGVEYNFLPNHNLEGRLSFNYYFANDDYNQKLILNYKYNF